MLSRLTTRIVWRRVPALLGAAIVLGAAAACASGHKAATPPAPVVNAPVTSGASATPSPSPSSPSGPADDSPVVAFHMHGSKDGNGKPFDVNAKVVPLGVDPATNVMQSPDNQNDVGYYGFTSHPGAPCQGSDQCANTVISGHVDWYTGGAGGGPSTGVFWNLRYLQNGDEIDLKLQDGRTYTYKVAATTVYSDENAPVQQIIGSTPQASITLITCQGDFNHGEYDSRLIVRGVQTSS